MGFKVGRNVPSMERELIYFLYDLCVNWGFCIPPDDQNRISKKEHYNAIEFAEDVVKAEGLEGYNRWVNKIARLFVERFGTDEIDSSSFVDRIRGVNESW